MNRRPTGPLLDAGIFPAVESVTLHAGGAVLVDGQDFGSAPVAITRSSLWLSAIGRPDRWRACTLVGFGDRNQDPWLRAQREEVRPVAGYGRTEAVCRRVFFPEPTCRPEAWRRAVVRLLHAYRHVHARSGCRDPYLRCAIDARPDGRLRVLVCGW